MALKLMYITNDPEIAQIAEESGVDRIFVDLEYLKKEERQKDLDTVKSRHSISDISPIKRVLTGTEVLVRVNPINKNSKKEIDDVIKAGADIVMLPYFKTVEEVEAFLGFVDKKAKVCLLVETPSAVENLDDILSLKGIDEVHIGLNDLHLGYGMNFMFELLSNGTVDRIVSKIKEYGIPYGFGGIARIGKGLVPSELIIGEHYRLGSSMAILSRSFCNISAYKPLPNDSHLDLIREVFEEGVKEIRDFEEYVEIMPGGFYESNRIKTNNAIKNAVDFMISRRQYLKNY